MTPSPSPRTERSYRALLTVPGLGRILTSMMFARIAQAMVGVALVLFTLDEYGSPALTGIVTAASVLPGLLIAPIAGALLDRQGRTKLVMLDYAVALAVAGPDRRARPSRRAAGAAPPRDHDRQLPDLDPVRDRAPEPVPAPRPGAPLGAGQRDRLERLPGRDDRRPATGGDPRHGLRRGHGADPHRARLRPGDDRDDRRAGPGHERVVVRQPPRRRLGGREVHPPERDAPRSRRLDLPPERLGRDGDDRRAPDRHPPARVAGVRGRPRLRRVRRRRRDRGIDRRPARHAWPRVGPARPADGRDRGRQPAPDRGRPDRRSRPRGSRSSRSRWRSAAS